ncbi:polyprenyl diphosphate synthase [Gottschalkiaceae bacterium SANA]|nr:polyprenyl diphosphate synthase [Gottschalkiaceae bacterium SANA]
MNNQADSAQVNTSTPRHIAVIMDGNGRWAIRKGNQRSDGHRAGSEAVRNLVSGALDFKIPYITIYAFSTENWSRPKKEVDFLFRLLSQFIDKELTELKKTGVRVRFIGRRDRISKFLVAQMESMELETCENTKLSLTLAIDYGGRDEIHRAIERMQKAQQTSKTSWSPADLHQFLDAPELPDPDLVIRTSGEIRLSNFLIYQAAYAELWFTEELWPDFTKETLSRAILDYQKRHRRFGKIK